jgi:hypothetical protein
MCGTLKQTLTNDTRRTSSESFTLTAATVPLREDEDWPHDKEDRRIEIAENKREI